MNENANGVGRGRHPIGVVAERTGLSLDVLRVWERRYGVVEPKRDEGGRRLYSDADIERLRLLAQATSGGRSIGQVAALPAERLRELVREDEAARWTASRASPRRAASDEAIERALERARALDGEGLDAVLRRASSLMGAPVFMEEVVPVLARRIGDEWHAGRMTVAQEHLASGVLRPLLAELRAALPVTPDAPVLVVATPAGERHDIGALLAAAAAAAEGWRVTYLGADVPAAEIAGAVRATRARAVALSTVYVWDPAAVANELAALRALLPADVAILLGGAGLAVLNGGVPGSGAVPLATLPEFRAWLRAGAFA